MTELDEFEPITLEQVREAAREIAAALPDRVNPVGYTNICVYTSPTDSTWHCIAGQLVEHLGLAVPEHNGGFASRAVAGYFTPDAVTYVCDLQSTADLRVGGKNEPRRMRPWREVVELVETSRDLRG